jgi:Tol biopolymer transport system component
VQETLAGRDLTDITSGAVSPDGDTLVFRTGGDDSLYSLYAMDLTRSDGSFVQLVDGANFRLDYSFSPDGNELAYESNAAGRSVWVANADGSERRQLAVNASLPEWN